jgi:7-cyano-7-deazaguanine synthase in queuosine biosynthesis
MKITYGNQTIDFKCPDKVLISLSGGLDSAALLYLICYHFPDTEIVPYTGQDVTAPMDYECAKDILQYMRETFPTVNIRDHDVYKFDIWDEEWRQLARERMDKETTTTSDGTVIPKFTVLSGLVKVLMLRKNTERLRKQYPDHWILTGMTANPPVEEQHKYNFYDVAERRRDRRDNNPFMVMVKLYQPLMNVDKKFVAGVYKDHKLMDTLYPFTSSCVGSERDTEYFTKGCGKCFWCNEKKWAFET